MRYFLDKRKNFGVTLVEIIVVVSIIAILALISIVSLRTQVFKGNDGKRKGDIHKIQVAAEEYEKDKNCYPLSQYVICKPGTALKPYLDKIPCDPVTGASYYYEPEAKACPSWYRIYAVLNNQADSDITKLSCTNGCGPNLAFNYYASSPNAPGPATGGTGATSPPGGTPTPPPPGGGGVSFYGCKPGCVPISWDPGRPGPECDPNYQSVTCFGQCGSPETECKPWK